MTKTIPTYDKVHNRFKLNGNNYNYNDLKEVAYSLVKEGEPFEKNIGDFLMDWHNLQDYITIKTSGSTGEPKLVKISKKAMINSALATGDFLNLAPGDTALLCMPAQYVAGKMMLVRAMILGLDIDFVAPTSHPAYDNQKHYKFSAMVPLQVEKSLNNLNNIDTLIVGGAPVSKTLLQKLQNIPTKVYETFGMTETVSHIAIRKLNHLQANEQSTFKTLPNILLSVDERDCMVIDAPRISNQKIVTNDIIKLYSPTEFNWLGRYDNVINTGGVKVFPEQIEKKLENKIDKRFFITSETDSTLGQKVVMVVKGNDNDIDNNMFLDLDKFEVPKTIYNIPKFIQTPSGKVQRQKTLQAILNKKV